MPTLLRITGDQLLDDPETWQTEMFGPASLIVVADSTVQVLAITEKLEGNLAGSVYHAGLDDRESYLVIEPVLRRKVGRLLNNKMPTGVAVSPAMNHGGPYPATGHPGFTAVGFPASIPRFAVRRCFDNVDEVYLPAILRRGTST
jgi:NADP-dependent aldehyde dehydrogenase